MLALSLSDKFCYFGIFVFIFVFDFFVFVFNRFLFFRFSFVFVFIIFSFSFSLTKITLPQSDEKLCILQGSAVTFFRSGG